MFQDKDSKNREVEVDIDELLDMDNDDQRRRHLQLFTKELAAVSDRILLEWERGQKYSKIKESIYICP
ncbi:hypothetical protein J6590_077156 [Homalodisca vitripennis]|nr:hypothetical protein J6590_077156 [Homalodisca vitripennis]